ELLFIVLDVTGSDDTVPEDNILDKVLLRVPLATKIYLSLTRSLECSTRCGNVILALFFRTTSRADVWPIRPFASASPSTIYMHNCVTNNRGRKIVVLYRKSQSGSPAMYKILSSFNKIEDALPEDKEEQQDSDSP
ncbi:3417_t:CDS:2, partial [Entrophospora sp. SA101]